MKMELKNYQVTILGTQYSFVSDEPQEAVMQAAATVDMMMQELVSTNPLQPIHIIAILVALQSVRKMHECQGILLKQQVTQELLVKFADDALVTYMQK
jgi:cell division protein ZapA (FtsZ GTPase activity inhibitor)